MMKIMKRRYRILLIVLTVLIVLLSLAGNWAVDAGLSRNGWGEQVRQSAQKKTDAKAEDPNSNMYKVRQFRKSIAQQTKQFEADVPEEKITIESQDGLKLTGYLRKKENSHKYVICFHGYRASHQEITSLGFSKRFYDLGFNVLCPDQRAHGNSDGEWIGMGWLERKDVVSWSEYIVNQDSQAEILLFGESMGAASVLAACGEELPASVKAVISDSGYAGTASIASEAMWKQAHIPSFPLLNIGNIFCYLKAGYTLKSNDISNALQRCTIPVLLFQGSEDSIVSSENMQKLYDAIPHENKEEVLIEGADHVCSSQLEPDLYWTHVEAFLKKYDV